MNIIGLAFWGLWANKEYKANRDTREKTVTLHQETNRLLAELVESLKAK